MRQREDDVHMGTRQQPLQLGGDPQLTRPISAARARAMATGVVLQVQEVALGADHGMAADGGGVAVADAPGGAQLTRVQRARSGVAVEVSGEDVLHRAVHGRWGVKSANARVHERQSGRSPASLKELTARR